MSITIEDTKNYMARNGSPFDNGEWLLELKRQNQVKEAIENDYDRCDFDRWQHLQNIIFGNDYQELDWDSSQQIINILYEKDIEVLDIWSFKDQI